MVKLSYAASRERLTALSSIGLDTLHPYAHSSSPQYGIWHNMIEPLVEVDYAKQHLLRRACRILGVSGQALGDQAAQERALP